jgi:hypothetical protein
MDRRCKHIEYNGRRICFYRTVAKATLKSIWNKPYAIGLNKPENGLAATIFARLVPPVPLVYSASFGNNPIRRRQQRKQRHTRRRLNFPR